MTSPVRLPHLSQGNLLTDVSQAAASLAGGVEEERTKRREDAMREALLAVQRMNAQAALNRSLEPQRPFVIETPFSKIEGIDEAGRTPAGNEYALLSPTGQVQRTGTPVPPPKPPSPFVVVGETGAQVIPRTPGQHEFAPGFVPGPTDRQQRMLREPSPEENSRASSLTTALHAQKGLDQLERTDPNVANRAGFIEFLRTVGPNVSGEAAAAALAAQLTNDPAAQKYMTLMREWIASTSSAIGKAWTASELAVQLPRFFSFGFQSDLGLQALQQARESYYRSALVGAGPGLIPLIRTGYLNIQDIPNFERWRQYWLEQYGVDVAAGLPQTPGATNGVNPRFDPRVPRP